MSDIPSHKLNELEQRARLEGGELGDYWSMLLEMNSYTYAMDGEFELAFKKELSRAADSAVNNFEIVEEEKEITRTERRLEYRPQKEDEKREVDTNDD